MIKMKNLFYLKSRLCFTALLLFCTVNIFSQSLSVDYSVRKNNKTYKATLINYDNVSVYTEFYSKIKDSIYYEQNESGSRTIIYNPLEDLHFVKNFKEEKILCKGSILNKKYFVSDSLYIFKWKIEKDTTSIMGLKCNIATLEFRGRKYTAFYSDKIKLSDGPWKFNGLPGLILKISSADNLYSFEATNISKNKDLKFDYISFIENYKKNRTEISFVNYREEKHQKLKELYLKQKSEHNETGGSYNKYTEIEVIYDYPPD